MCIEGGGGGGGGNIYSNVYKKGIKICEARLFWICSIDVTLTFYLQVSSADNFCKQFGTKCRA